MWVRVALPLSVVLALVRLLLNVTPSAPCRRAWRVSRWQPLRASCPDRPGWLGKDESRQHRAPSGFFVFSDAHCVLASGPTSEFGLCHGSSVLRDVVFTNQVPNRSINPDEDVGCGAAVQAAIVNVVGSSQAKNLPLPDTTSSSIGLMIDGVMTKLIELNTTIPLKTATGEIVHQPEHSVIVEATDLLVFLSSATVCVDPKTALSLCLSFSKATFEELHNDAL